MDIKIKEAILCEIKDLKVSSVEDAHKMMCNFKTRNMGILITDGKTDVADTSHGIFLAINVYLEDKYVKGDIIVIDPKFNFFYDLETYDGIFYETVLVKDKPKLSKGAITFIPVKNKNGDFTHFQIDNKFSNIEKMKADVQHISSQNVIKPIITGDKYLDLDLKFRLSHGFKGDLQDAFLELYRHVSFTNKDLTSMDDFGGDTIFEDWCNCVNTTGEPIYGDINIKTILK